MSETTKPEFLHSQLTGQIIGCAMKVHAVLGNGFQEVIYQRSLAIEFEKLSCNLHASMKCLFSTIILR